MAYLIQTNNNSRRSSITDNMMKKLNNEENVKSKILGRLSKKRDGVYEMDTDADHSITRMMPLVAGMGYNKAAEGNKCSVDSVSNPDNLLVLDNGNVVIGEDTSNHENNMLWVYNRN